MRELVAVILQLLGGGKHGRIDRAAPMAVRIWRIDLRTASRKAWLAFSIKCPRSATCTASGSPASASPTHAGQPRLGGRRFSIWQQRDRLPAFEITDQRSIAMAAAPGPIIVADDRRGAKLGLPRLRMAHSRVSLLTDMLQRSEKLAAGRPPRASAKQWTI